MTFNALVRIWFSPTFKLLTVEYDNMRICNTHDFLMTLFILFYHGIHIEYECAHFKWIIRWKTVDRLQSVFYQYESNHNPSIFSLCQAKYMRFLSDFFLICTIEQNRLRTSLLIRSTWRVVILTPGVGVRVHFRIQISD